MVNKILYNKTVNLHFVGVLGVSTSALAEYFLERGYAVSGSDLVENERAKLLIKKGLKFYKGHNAKNVRGADAVIYTAAVGRENAEIRYAERKKIPLVKRSELLGAILSAYKKSVAISGSHGKTTATAMIADVLKAARLDPTVFLGGEHSEFNVYRSGKSEYIVAEACEYKKSFLDIKPYIAVVLNVDNDHLDSYGNMSEMERAFGQFISPALSLINVDDKRAKNIVGTASVTFGIENPAVYTVKNLKFNGVGYSFTARAYSRTLGKINLSVIGKHNVYNALAAVAVADMLKINFKTVKYALESFRGVGRRAEYLGKLDNLDCFADYAHHPKEIQATLSAFNETGKKVGVVFQPHTYSRTENLMDEFIIALKDYDTIIYKTYAARESYNEKGSAKTLYDRLSEKTSKALYYADDEKQIKEKIALISGKIDTLIFLGAGDIYDSAKTLIKNAKNNL